MNATQKKRALTTLAYIETHPKEWNQSDWRCKTGMCFAGHVALTFSRCKPLLTDKEWAEYSELVYRYKKAGYDSGIFAPAERQRFFELRPHYDKLVATNADDPDSVLEPKMTGLKVPVVSIADRARRLLGISEYELAGDGEAGLFAGDNKIHDIRRILAGLMSISQAEVRRLTKEIATAEGWVK